MATNTNKVSNMYGRARRIEFVEKCVYVIVGIFAIFLIFYFVSHTVNKEDKNVNFAFLKNYMETKGYSCERIDVSGGKCSLYNTNSSNTYIRYDDGFELIKKTKAYTLTIRHAKGHDSKISFVTTTEAFSGYKAKTYNCSFKNTVLEGLEECVDDDKGTVLDNASYIGLIEMSISDLNEIVDNSGYNKKILIEKNEWKKEE